jgi:hypothetical protein
MTRALKLMSLVEVNHGHHLLESKEVNSESLETQQDGYTEREETMSGDHSLLTTSGIMTTVPTLFAETSVTERVLEPRREMVKTEKTLIMKLDTEDVLITTITSFNAESMVDQIIMIEVLMLGLTAQAQNGYHTTLELVKNSESPEKVGLKERAEMDTGDH